MNRKLFKQESGVIIVEIAVILPFLILLILGIWDLGLLAHEHQVLQNAAREGARFSAQHRIGDHGVTLAAIQNRVVTYCSLQNITIQQNDVTVDQTFQYSLGTTTIQASEVIITRSRALLTPGMAQLLGQTVTVRGRGVFSNFY